jgi:putative transposase
MISFSFPQQHLPIFYREDILNAYLFNSLKEVRDISEQWLEEYNTDRPHEALHGLSPYQYTIQNA